MLNIVDQKLLDDTGQHLLYFPVPPNVGHQDMAFESSALCVVISLHPGCQNQSVNLDISIWLVLGELRGPVSENVGILEAAEGRSYLYMYLHWWPPPFRVLIWSQRPFSLFSTFLSNPPPVLLLSTPEEAKVTWCLQAFSIGSKCFLHYCKYVNKALIVIFHLTCPNVPCPYGLLSCYTEAVQGQSGKRNR